MGSPSPTVGCSCLARASELKLTLNFIKPGERIKRDVIHLGLVEVGRLEVEQICHQLPARCFLTSFHVFKIERLLIVGNKSGKSVYPIMEPNGFEIMCNGQHHLRALRAVRPPVYWLSPTLSVTVTAGDVAPNEWGEDDRQQWLPAL